MPEVIDTVNLIQDHDGLIAALDVVSRKTAIVAKHTAGRQAEVAKVEKRFNRFIHKHQAVIDAETERITQYVLSHMDELLAISGGKLTIALQTGAIKITRGRERIVVTGPSAVIDRLERLGFADCIRIKKEIDKKKLSPDVIKAVRGLSVKRGDDTVKVIPLGEA